MSTATISITELRGCLPAPPSPVTLAEMDAAIAAGAGERVVGKKARKRKTWSASIANGLVR
jgi:hypothetical protein